MWRSITRRSCPLNRTYLLFFFNLFFLFCFEKKYRVIWIGLFICSFISLLFGPDYESCGCYRGPVVRWRMTETPARWWDEGEPMINISCWFNSWTKLSKLSPQTEITNREISCWTHWVWYRIEFRLTTAVLWNSYRLHQICINKLHWYWCCNIRHN